MIDGVTLRPLRRICDERGKVMHMLRRDDPEFEAFGEIYFATAYPGVVKGWHLHREMALNYAVLKGMAKIVLYDDRAGSPTHGEVQEIFAGEDAYALVHVPPRVWNGWKAIGDEVVLLANCATHPHRPDEMERRDPHAGGIPYDWALVHR